jgi:hypothetical protein
MTHLFNLSGNGMKYCFSAYFSLGSSVTFAGNRSWFTFGENVPKIYFNLLNVYGETLAFVRRRIVCSIAKILEVTDFKIIR